MGSMRTKPTMSIDRKTVIRQWLLAHPTIIALVEEGNTFQLLELSSGKQLALELNCIETIEVKTDAETKGRYLVIVLDTGYQLVLCQQGLAFAPDFTNTGPIEMPVSVLCMGDYQKLYDQLKHTTYEHPELRRNAVDLVMLLIALLDGARNIGLDVDRESARVERVLEAIEKQTLPDPNNL